MGIVLDGELVFARGFGVRDRTDHVPIDANTVFRIASLTKSFTALAVLKLRDENRLELDAPAAKYYPPLASVALPTRDSPPISARLLLTNAAGLAYDDLWGAETYGRTEQQLRDWLHSGLASTATPGTKYAYSNLGWALLGKVVEGASNMRFTDYVKGAILRPLGMNATVFEPSEVSRSKMAISYHLEAGQPVEDERAAQGVFQPGGGLYTSLNDYARYISYNLAAYPPRDDPESGPVRRSTLREMHEGQRRAGHKDKNTPIVRVTDDEIVLRAANYGFGWFNTATCADELWLRHGGYEPSYFSLAMLIPSQRVAVITFATSAPIGMGASEQAVKILRAAGVLEVASPSPHSALLAAELAVSRLLTHWDDSLLYSIFDRDGLRYWWNKNLRAEFARLSSDHGVCSPDGTHVTYDSLHSDFRVVCERGAIEFDLLMTPTEPPAIQAIDWKEELAIDERSEKMAYGLAALMGRWDDTLAAGVLASSVASADAKHKLVRAGVDHGTCAVGSGVFERDRDAWFHSPGHYRFELDCERGRLELSFKIDDAENRVGEFSLRVPHRATATCWE